MEEVAEAGPVGLLRSHLGQLRRDHRVVDDIDVHGESMPREAPWLSIGDLGALDLDVGTGVEGPPGEVAHRGGTDVL